METTRRLLLSVIFPLLLPISSALAQAANAAQGTIPVGTRITMKNWQRYKQFMPDGMIVLFEGKYF